MTDEEKQAIEYFENKLQELKEEIKERQNDEFKGYGTLEDIAKLKYCNLHTMLNLIEKQQAEIEKKDKWINKLETKLMYALTPTKHELAKRTQEEFKEIIRKNIDEDTYTIKRKLKEEWNNL